MGVRWLRIGLSLGLVALLTLSLPASEPSRSLETRLTLLLQGESFYFPEWALQAWAEKLLLSVANPQAFLDDETQRRAVRRYLQRLSEAREAAAALEREVSAPTPPEPEAIAALRRQWEAAHGRAQALRPLAEAILSEQLGVILAQEGLALLGQPIPPVQIRLTAMPNLLVLSPRERIALTTSFPLRADLTADEMDRLERRVDGQLNLSSLVVPLGGLAFYPAMIMEATGLPELTEIIAHEWTHHWLFMGPLGWFYDRPEARTINETVADLAGKAMGRAWLARFYPEDLPSPPADAAPAPAPPERPAFDFGRELAKTRTVVERLLAQGEVRRAELYMEARRRVFVAHGYALRKLNQAYFAFYGAYAAEEGAAGAEDPIGPRVRRLWAQSPSLRAFLFRMLFITDLAGLRRALGEPLQ
ncbi:MAG: hypothetical protein KNN16_00115 [Thermoflexus hugenholtzii]|jgi:hypothetical protein|uniref:hypothetical protein n=1 Tax=Thermoflexus TaxID=1495649 RepID=UPI001C757636|nr:MULTISPECIES: hypothetical protein [Thermoflexus]QWK10691.1 MAG: hypothetical protein KNN16_00115 [Thermoflexus hugenholtzii]